MKKVIAISASDSSGAAGMQSDLKTFCALGVHGGSIITAVTSQNENGVLKMDLVDVVPQFEALKEFDPQAIKIGVVGRKDFSDLLPKCFTVLDPVLFSSSGCPLSDLAQVRKLLPRVNLVTPNLDELEILAGTRDPLEGAKIASHVLIKGGHAVDDFSRDFWTDGINREWIISPRLPRAVRGTGCALSSAIAAEVAKGTEVLDAIVVAKAYVARGIRLGETISSRMAVLGHGPWPVEAQDFPILSQSKEPEPFIFPRCGEIGFYPIVDRAEWVRKFLPLGVKTIQLRIKDLSGEALRREISEAVRIARQYSCQLFINDYWDLALEFGAYGVHLGQEDLISTDISRLAKASLRLGISTHSYSELARARAFSPSYVALGPIFPTTIKEMKFAPQGIEKISEWVRLAGCPVVAIGGITLDKMPTLQNTGASGFAVITDLFQSPNPTKKATSYLTGDGPPTP